MAASRAATPLPAPLRTHAAHVVYVGSDCTGYGSETIALRLALPHVGNIRPAFCSEIDTTKIRLLRAMHQYLQLGHVKFLGDIKNRDHADAPRCHLYVAGAPCPAYSFAGRQRGLRDKKDRGSTLFHCLAYVRAKTPRVVVLENVVGLVRGKNATVGSRVRDILENLGYSVKMGLMSTKDYGVPQNRNRVYWVAIRGGTKEFNFPAAIPKPRFARFLETTAIAEASPNPNPKVMERFEKKYGAKLTKKWIVVDTGASVRFSSAMLGRCPCITRTRAGGNYFVPKLNRMLTITELGRLQGLPSPFVQQLLAAVGGNTKALGRALGDGMSINVLMAVLPEALHCAGLIDAPDPNPWLKAPTAAGILPDCLFDGAELHSS